MKKTFTLILSLVVALMTLQASAAMYIVGNGPFGNWEPDGGVQMTSQGSGTYTYSTVVSGEVYFVFGDGRSSNWTTFNNNYRYGPSTGDTQVPIDGTWTTTQKAGDHGAYYFTGDGSTYTFTFDQNNKRFKITGEGGTVDPGVLYILGEVNGHGWSPAAGRR